MCVLQVLSVLMEQTSSALIQQLEHTLDIPEKNRNLVKIVRIQAHDIIHHHTMEVILLWHVLCYK